MLITENREKFLKYIKDVFKIIKEKSKENFDEFLTDEKAEELANDEKRIADYIRAKKIVDDLDKRNTMLGSIKDIEKQHTLNRILPIMINPNDEKESREILKKYSTVEGARELSKNIINDVINANYFNPYTKEDGSVDIDKCFETVENDFDTCYKSFSFRDLMIHEGNTLMNPVLENFLSNNAGILQKGGDPLSLIRPLSSVLNLAIPEEIISNPKFQIEDITFDVIMLGSEYKEFEGLDASSIKKIPGQLFVSNQVKEKSKYISKAIDLIKNYSECESTADLIKNYHFKDAKSVHNVQKELRFQEVIDIYSQYFKDLETNPDTEMPQVNIVRYTDKEKEELNYAFNKPYIKELDDDKEISEQLAIDMYKEFSNYSEFEEFKDKFTKEEALKNLYDSKRIELHKKAKEILATGKKYEKVYADTCKKLKLNPYGRVSASLIYHMDISGSKEGNKKNEDLIRKLSTRQGEIDYVSELFRNVVSYDYEELFNISDEKLLDNYEETRAKMFDCYALLTIFGDSHIDLPANVKEFINNNKGLIESLDYGVNVADRYANELFLVTPPVGELFVGKNAPVTYGVLNDVRRKYDTKVINPKGEKESTNSITDFFLKSSSVAEAKKIGQTITNLVATNVVESGCILSNNFFTDENDKVVNSRDFINNMDGKKVKCYGAKAQADMLKIVEEGFQDKIFDFLKEIKDKKNQILECINTINNANAKISIFNSSEYTTIKRNSTAVIELLNSDEFKNFENNCGMDYQNIANNAFNTIKAYKESLDAYVNKKRFQTKNETRQLRYSTALRLSDEFRECGFDDAFEKEDEITIYEDALPAEDRGFTENLKEDIADVVDDVKGPESEDIIEGPKKEING